MCLRLSRQREARQAPPQSNFGATSGPWMAQRRGPGQVAEVQCRRHRQWRVALATAQSLLQG
eukprot:1416117-Prorocentrum_lima.AAC.1